MDMQMREVSEVRAERPDAEDVNGRPPSCEPSAFLPAESSSAFFVAAGGPRDIMADLRAMLAEHARHAERRRDPREPARAVVDEITARFRAGWRD